VRRVVVLGGLGFFGRTAAAELRKLGLHVRTASRRHGADLRIDANDPESIRAEVRHGDIVLDAAGPYYARTPALIEAAIDVGFDVVDLNDDLSYAEMVLAQESRIAERGIRVLTSASTVSAFSAAVMQIIGPESPNRFTSFLAPATRRTANAGTANSLLRTIGKPIRVLRDGVLQTVRGWQEKRSFQFGPSQKMSPICGHVFESADALWLPRMRPSLRDVAMYVDANIVGANTLLSLAARSNLIRSLLERTVGFGTSAARQFGSETGGVAYELEGADGRTARFALIAEKKSYMVAIAPAVLATQKLASDGITDRGLILPDRYADPTQILGFLQSAGVKFIHSRNV
jgi:short subunit dehydrogenase-like uncharacterized protein